MQPRQKGTNSSAVSGFKSVIDAQPWLISKVTHNLDSSRFVTMLNLEVLLSDVSYEATESDGAE
ncbi:UNVERIFIED_ORG: phage protein D [Rahnella aquatilis]|nr:phage protein D [Rahnella aquatilis]